MIAKTEAVVLSAIKFRDTSKIVRLYTREFGKVAAVAKGARDAKSKFRSALEPMTHVSAVIYKNDNRELQLLSQCDSISAFYHLTEESEKMYAALSAIELVDVITHDEERNEQLFDLLINHLKVVNSATNNAVIALYYFETVLSELLGFKLDLNRCSYCGNETTKTLSEGARVVIYGDGVLCASCSETSTLEKISPAALRAMQRLQEVHSADAIMTLRLPSHVQHEVGRSLRQHLRNHIEGFRGLKSEEVFAAIL